ncbi:hypothetical protein NQ315_004307 [Exocentrus adspersus]|uniref:G-protein coupled receptors family 2 profile 2 domain-containing protein n=1 Tax=Exocentrus adspersus TaxID=1586481 RepID=A0AAV8W7J7_9CUCU|nr:hypothetical protein NQ315_004307 [Exocentrus adspersus]
MFSALVLAIIFTNKADAVVNNNNNDSVRLCLDAPEVDYENYTSATTENCGCKEGGLCVRKCCQSGFTHYHDEDADTGFFLSVCTRTKNDSSNNFTVPIHDGEDVFNASQEFKVGTLTCNNPDWQYFRMDNTNPNQQFRIMRNGSLYYEYYGMVYNNDRYCLDEQNGLTAYVCFTPPPPPDANAWIHVAAKLISVPFLLVTLVVYALLPERNLHRSALMHHVFALIPGNIFLAIGQYFSIEDNGLCSALAYFILLFMVSSFFWMNVICIDIFFAFSGLRGCYVQGKLKKRIYAVAFIYAWGLPALDVLIVYLFNTYGDIDANYYPGIGLDSCFLADVAAMVFYFGPIVILILTNLVLFSLTAINIQKAKKEASIVDNSESRRHTPTEDDRFKLYWKLLFVMGLNPIVNTHVIQLISWSMDKAVQRNIVEYIWYFKDFSHATYGLVIFLVFVCQKKIWVSLKERFHCICKSNKVNSCKTSATTSSCTPSSENGTTAVRLRGIQNVGADIP